MRWLRALVQWLGFGRGEDAPPNGTEIDLATGRPRFLVHYDHVVEVATQAEGAAAAADGSTIAVVQGSSGSKWLMLRCPCGCREIRRISVAPPVEPSWSLSISKDGEVSLYPSVWLMGECRAHFVLRNNTALVL